MSSHLKEEPRLSKEIEQLRKDLEKARELLLIAEGRLTKNYACYKTTRGAHLNVSTPKKT